MTQFETSHFAILAPFSSECVCVCQLGLAVVTSFKTILIQDKYLQNGWEGGSHDAGDGSGDIMVSHCSHSCCCYPAFLPGSDYVLYFEVSKSNISVLILSELSELDKV